MQENKYLARTISALFSVFILISCTSKHINEPEKVGELSTKAQIESGLPAVIQEDIGHNDILQSPTTYLKIEYHQEAVSPLLMRIRNTSPFPVAQLGLESTLFDPDGNQLDKKEWTITEQIQPGMRSKLYLTPVTYHLAHEHKILTRILLVRILER